MEVRPRVASGVLLHVHTAEGYFTVHIDQGAVSRWHIYVEAAKMYLLFKSMRTKLCCQVVVLVNDGKHEFSTKVSPRQGLCASNWHRITGEKPTSLLSYSNRTVAYVLSAVQSKHQICLHDKTHTLYNIIRGSDSDF